MTLTKQAIKARLKELRSQGHPRAKLVNLNMSLDTLRATLESIEVDIKETNWKPKTKDPERRKSLADRVQKLRDMGYDGGYIHLGTSSIEELEAYIKGSEGWRPPLPPETEEPEPAPPADFSEVLAAKTLSQLGRAIARLEGTGAWNQWRMSYWSKNGECRIYMTDCGYVNPKSSGYMLVGADGSITYNETRGRFPRDLSGMLPEVENDLTAEVLPGVVRRLTESEAEAIANSPRQQRDRGSDEYHFGAADEESF